MSNVFAVPVFFVTFREALESSIIISVLLSFLKQTVGTSGDGDQEQSILYKRMRRQVWLGTGLGLLVCLLIGGAFIGIFYAKGINSWSKMEDVWEGVFNIVASVIITIMGASILRITKLQEKWKQKLAAAFEAHRKRSVASWTRKYFMLILPFITVLREGLEAVVFIGGVSLSSPATAFPLPAICGLLAGALVGFLLYNGGNRIQLQRFLVASTVFLYLVAAGLFSKGIWDFEMYAYTKLVGGDVAETGMGPGSYDIRKSVWHVNCCSPQYKGGGGWSIFYAVLGWQNSATYGSVISYNLYWVAIAIGFILMSWSEKKERQSQSQNQDEPDPENVSHGGNKDSGVVHISVLEEATAPREEISMAEITN